MTGVTSAAPISMNFWLEELDAACHKVNLNGIMFGETIVANPAMPNMNIKRPNRNGSEAVAIVLACTMANAVSMTSEKITSIKPECIPHADRTAG